MTTTKPLPDDYVPADTPLKKLYLLRDEAKRICVENSPFRQLFDALSGEIESHIAAQAGKIEELEAEISVLESRLDDKLETNEYLNQCFVEIKEENTRLREALQKAVDCYGKPGGPWNVPSEPGSWIVQAKEALK